MLCAAHNKNPSIKTNYFTAEALREEYGERFGDFQVIFCGKKPTDRTDKERRQKFIEKAEKANVKIQSVDFNIKIRS